MLAWRRDQRSCDDRSAQLLVDRTDGGPVDTAFGMLLNTDAMTHGDMIDRLATYGDPLAIERLILISSLTDPARAEDAARAKRALAMAPKAAVTKAAKAIAGK